MEKDLAIELLEKIKKKEIEREEQEPEIVAVDENAIPQGGEYVYEKMSDDPELDRFMNDFVSQDKLAAEFKKRVETSKLQGEEIFSFEEYCKLKMEHPDLNVVIINATKILNNQDNKYFLVKPLYSKEYFEFVETFGPHEKNLSKFFDYIIEKCILFPNNINGSEKLPAGTSNTIYVTVLNISDLNTISTIMVI